MTQKVTIAYCHGGMVTGGFMDCLLKLCMGEHHRYLEGTTSARGLYIHQLRNGLVKTFLHDTNGDWLLMLDTDMTFEPTLLEDMLKLADPEDVPILAGLYIARLQPNNQGQMRLLPCWGHRTSYDYAIVESIPDEPLIELQWCGMGCTLIHRSVLEAMKEANYSETCPWFDYETREVNGAQQWCGEDVAFCARAAEQGFKTYGATQIVCGHIKSMTIHPEGITG